MAHTELSPNTPSDASRAQLPDPVALPHWAVIEVKGADAGTFLQGQLTQDVVSMEAHHARAGGYCSAKGRLLGNFVILHPAPDAWWLVTRAALVESLVRRLRMFVLRAQCTVAARPDLNVVGHWSTPLAPWQVDRADAEILMGWWGSRALRIRPETAGVTPELPGAADHTIEPAATQWDRADIAAGWPWIEPATVEQFVPQMVNFEALGGVNFRKGCYPGQEVVARSQYRGTLKRRMGLFTSSGSAPLPGTEIFHSEDPEQPAGMVVNAAADPRQPDAVWVLAEVKTALLENGSLHLTSPHGAVLAGQPLPYAIPSEV